MVPFNSLLWECYPDETIKKKVFPMIPEYAWNGACLPLQYILKRVKQKVSVPWDMWN